MGAFESRNVIKEFRAGLLRFPYLDDDSYERAVRETVVSLVLEGLDRDRERSPYWDTQRKRRRPHKGEVEALELDLQWPFSTDSQNGRGMSFVHLAGDRKSLMDELVTSLSERPLLMQVRNMRRVGTTTTIVKDMRMNVPPMSDIVPNQGDGRLPFALAAWKTLCSWTSTQRRANIMFGTHPPCAAFWDTLVPSIMKFIDLYFVKLLPPGSSSSWSSSSPWEALRRTGLPFQGMMETIGLPAMTQETFDRIDAAIRAVCLTTEITVRLRPVSRKRKREGTEGWQRTLLVGPHPFYEKEVLSRVGACSPYVMERRYEEYELWQHKSILSGDLDFHPDNVPQMIASENPDGIPSEMVMEKDAMLATIKPCGSWKRPVDIMGLSDARDRQLRFAGALSSKLGVSEGAIRCWVSRRTMAAAMVSHGHCRKSNKVLKGVRQELSDALYEYTTYRYVQVNEWLRTFPREEEPSLEAMVSNVIEAISMMPETKHDVLVCRGVNDLPFDVTTTTTTTETIHDAGFSSMSIDPDTCTTFARMGDEPLPSSRGTLMRIRIPSGTKLLFTWTISCEASELEVVTYPGMVCRVTGRSTLGTGAGIVHVVDCVYESNMYGSNAENILSGETV